MNKHGFTLIELLVVVMIMGILTAIAMPQYRRSLDRSKSAEAMQLLPALFEARERWMIEHACTWDSSGYTCPGGETLSVAKLDIESKGTRSGTQLTTENFVYELLPSDTGTGTYQQCVTATPTWGESRGLGNTGGTGQAATIYFRGDKFSCKDGTISGGCDILNVDEANGGGSCK